MGTVHAKEVQITEKKPTRDEIPAKEIELGSISAKVQRIHIDGLDRTKNDIVVKQVKDVFAARNFEQMMKEAVMAKQRMESIGLVKEVSLHVDTYKGKDARADGYQVTYKVKEHNRVTGGISTMVGTNDGSLVFKLRLPNIFGRAENLAGEYSFGTKHATGLGLDFTKPVQGNPNLFWRSSLFQSHGEYPWSGYVQADKGISTSLTFPSWFGEHSVSWEGVWRDIRSLSNTTAFAVREEAGHSLKSAVKHVWIRDQRDSKVLPTSGTLLKSTQEMAGLGGDVSFLKQDLELQFNKTLVSDVVFQLSLAGGLVRTLNPDLPMRLPDRFVVGGPLTLRGFSINGCGPHSDGCALGGDTYWLAAAHIYTPLPFRSSSSGFGRFFRTHIFANAGNLTNIDLKDNWRRSLRNLSDSFRFSYGAGLVLMMGGIARLEVNYCIPLNYLAQDNINPGFQFGIGVTFL